MSVEQNIYLYLKNNGISQRHIARKTGIRPCTLNMTLKGNRRLQIDELLLICKAIDKEPAYFLRDHEPCAG